MSPLLVEPLELLGGARDGAGGAREAAQVDVARHADGLAVFLAAVAAVVAGAFPPLVHRGAAILQCASVGLPPDEGYLVAHGRCVFHCSTASGSRSYARRSGFCGVIVFGSCPASYYNTPYCVEHGGRMMPMFICGLRVRADMKADGQAMF